MLVNSCLNKADEIRLTQALFCQFVKMYLDNVRSGNNNKDVINHLDKRRSQREASQTQDVDEMRATNKNLQ